MNFLLTICRQSFVEMLGIDLVKAGPLIEAEKEKDLLKT